MCIYLVEVTLYISGCVKLCMYTIIPLHVKGIRRRICMFCYEFAYSWYSYVNTVGIIILYLFPSVSSSSSYSDLMPQFLRAVRALCRLYPHYRQALQRSEIARASNITPHSVPTSPAIVSNSAPNVHRAGSFGSLLENTSHHSHHPRTQYIPAATNTVQSTTRRGHRRTHSQTLPVSSGGDVPPISPHSFQNGATPNRGGIPVLGDPFVKLEPVWSSLESWFDLILTEVERTVDGESGAGGRGGGRDLLRRRMEGVEGSGDSEGSESANTAPSAEPRPGGESEREDPAGEREGERKNRRGLTLGIPQSTEVAAAIVKSTPVERRVAYLG